jgi:hypothetical protein
MNQPAGADEPGNVTCKACGTSIASTAYVCPECGEYQAKWRSELKYWAGVASLIALVSSGVAFTFGFLKFTKDYLSPHDLVVSELDTFGSAVFVNMSGQNVWIKYLRVTSENPTHNLRWDVSHVLAPQKLHSVNLVELSSAQFRGLTREMFGSAQGTYANRLSADTVATIRADMNTAQKEYVTSFLLQDGPEHKQVADFLKGTITSVRCKADLTYTYLESQSDRVVSIPCIGVIKHRTAPRKPAGSPRQR